MALNFTAKQSEMLDSSESKKYPLLFTILHGEKISDWLFKSSSVNNSYLANKNSVPGQFACSSQEESENEVHNHIQ